LLAQLAKGCLLLGDRRYSRSAFADLALDRCIQVGSHFLFRARSTEPLAGNADFRGRGTAGYAPRL
jgi:urease beta subunit